MSKSRSYAYIIWLLASFFYAYQYLLRVMPNIMLEDFLKQFDVSSAAFGQFSGVYYLGYSLMHIPLGVMLDRFGPKKIMTVCVGLTVLGMLPLLYAHNFSYPLLGRALIGMGSSAAILGLFKIIRMTFAENRFTRMLSLSVTIGLLGAIYGGGPVSSMVVHLGYQHVLRFFILGGLGLTILTYLIMPNLEEPHDTGILSDIKTVLSSKQVLALCLFSGLMVGPLEGFADVWGAQFLCTFYHIDHQAASYLTSMIFVGMCFGAPVLSYMGERRGNYLGVVMGSAFVMAILYVGLLLKITQHEAILAAIFLVIGTCSSYQVLSIYKASTYVQPDVAGLTTAIANMIIMTFGYAFHSSIGLTISAFGGIHNEKAYFFGIGIIPCALLISGLGLSMLYARERQGKRPKVSKYQDSVSLS